MAKTSEAVEYARSGDTDYFKAIDINDLVNARNEGGSSVLMIAAIENHLECCREIYRRSPSLIYHTNILFGATALHYAAWKGRAEIVEFLIYADYYINAESGRRVGEKIANKKLLLMVNNAGELALHVAVINRHVEATRILVQADPSHEQLSIVDATKRTALHHAIQQQNLEIVKLLVDNKPDFVYHPDVFGETPLKTAMKIALRIGDPNSANIRKLVIEKLAGQIKVRTGDHGRTSLHRAAAKGNLGALEDILQFSPDCLEMVDNEGMNFLHLAAMNGHVKIVERILQIENISEQILNAQDNCKDTPLHIAIDMGNASAALCLLYDSRVSKTIKNGRGQTAVELITFDYDKQRAGVYGVRDLINEEELKAQSDFDLVVCALIATVSFTAGITVPGGYINDGPDEGMAVLSKQKAFEAFTIANSCALSLSLSAVFSHFCTRLMQKRKDIDFQVRLATICTLGAIFTMVVTFITGSYAVLANSIPLAITVSVVSCSFFILASYAIWIVATQNKKPTPRSSANNKTYTRQYPKGEVGS